MDFAASSQPSQDTELEDFSLQYSSGTHCPSEDAGHYGFGPAASGVSSDDSVGTSKPFEDGEEDLRLPVVRPHFHSVALLLTFSLDAAAVQRTIQ